MRSAVSALGLITMLASTPAQASQYTGRVGETVRCPEWKELLASEQSLMFRKSPPKQSLADVLATADKNLPKSAVATGVQSSKATGKSASPKCDGRAMTHVVTSGDTLSAIAAKYLGSHKDYKAIASANGMKATTPLRVGQKLVIPSACEPGANRVAAVSKNTPSAKTTNSAKPQTSAPPPVIVPVWRAKPGEYLTDVLKRWGKSEGYTVISETSVDWQFSVPLVVRGEFEEAVTQAIRGFKSDRYPPGITKYDNKIMKVTAP
jgi:LysM repeat protein